MEQNDAQIGKQEETLEGNQLTENTSQQPAMPSMESLLEQEGLALDFPQQGEIRTGTIASIAPSQILVSVGAKSEGVISGRELENISDEEREAFEVGQEIPVFVVNPEDHNGNVSSLTLVLRNR